MTGDSVDTVVDVSSKRGGPFSFFSFLYALISLCDGTTTTTMVMSTKNILIENTQVSLVAAAAAAPLSN